MKQRPTYLIKTTLFALLLSWLLLAAGPAYATSVRAVPLLQASCTLPATVTTASQLRDCITAANGNGAGLDTITLGADITLTLTLPQITTAITLEGAGYTLDGANSRQIFNVGTAGDLTINEATLQNGFATNGGGAVYNDGTLTLINSTLSGNSAAAGAAVFNFLASTFTATNSTFSGNTATTNGGAIYNLDTMILTSNTFADNAAPTGGSLYNATPRGYLAGNIFAKGTNGANCVTGAAINDNGYNLSDDATCTNGGFDSQTNVTLNLGALTDNGGLTPTHLPGAGSDAIDAIHYGYAGNNNGVLLACNSSTTDQIGQYRPPIANSACTSGAVEVDPTAASLTIIKDANPAIGTDFDFIIGSTLLNFYSGSTSGKPFWTRPNEGGACTLSTVSTRYHVQAFMVDTSGSYNLSSNQQSGFNGYIHLYQDSFNPLAPCTNYLNGDDDALSTRSSELTQFLEVGRTYYFVTSGYSSSAAGNFTNNINGSGNAYTPYDAFTLDDAAPDDGDGVSSTVTYNVDPGTYTITEILPNSLWNLSNATCTGASGTVSLTDETLSVAISNGEAVQCTFVNERLCPASWTVTTADELSDCITLANANESPSPTADTITLGADITLSATLPQITSAITLEGAGHAVDGGDSVQLFYVASAGNFIVNQATLQNGYSATNGGGSYNRGTLTVTDSTFSGNRASYGGGIYNYTSGTLMVSNSTFSDNSATFGGGIYNDRTLTVSNSTFSNNSANDGGGIYNYYGGTLTVTNSTFSDNTATSLGSGVYNTIGTMYLAGTVFAAGSGGDNCTNNGTLHDNGYNLSDDASCVNGGLGSVTNATLALGNLADNGGPTQTHLPSAGSDAIGVIPNGTTISNNGASWTCDQSATDQQGVARPINSGDDCTAGAVEVTPICTAWTVTTAAELSDCITLANANESPSPTANTITLGADITLSTALPQISSEITLEGAGYAIDGGNSVQLFYVTSSGDFTVNQATLQNGSATDGGAIYNNNGRLTMTNSTISGNVATTDKGGGIFNKGTLIVTDSTISGNSANFHGGGIHNDGALTVSNSTFSGNRTNTGFGGGINTNGSLTVSNSTFSGNIASHSGGGITNWSTATVRNSTFSANRAGNGGGIHNEGDTLTATNNTFVDNRGNWGGTSISNYYAYARVYLAGNIFADNSTDENCYTAQGNMVDVFIDNGYNLSEDATCVNSGTGSANNATLSLGALADNGGPTLTHLPALGSEAIGTIPSGTTISNNGATWTCDQSGTDQRGELRPINEGTACTAGAVEVARVQLTMQLNGYFSWLPAPSGSCSESLYRSSTPYVGHTWLTDDPANYDGSGSLTSVATNYFYYLLVDCGGSQSQSNEVGEFTFAIVPGG